MNYRNPISDQMFWKYLADINLRSNRISNVGCLYFARAELPNLEKLDLSIFLLIRPKLNR